MSIPKPIVMETHMHTPLCRHARGVPAVYAEEALRKGLKGITVTCHAPLPEGFSPGVRMRDQEWPAYVELVEETQKQFEGQLEVFLGVESDFLPGLEPWLKELHARNDLQYVIGSVHPHLQEYRNRYFHGDWPAFQRQYFIHLAEAAESGLFDCISHPDLVKNLDPEAYDLDALLETVCGVLDRIAATGTAMELNTSGLLKTVPEMIPSLSILREMKVRDIPVVVGADAHDPERVAADYPQAYALLEQAGYTSVRYFRERTPVDISIEDARASLLF